MVTYSIWVDTLYVTISVCQGGIGIPFLAAPVYEYLCSEQCVGLSIKVADLPDPTLKFVIEKVHRLLMVLTTPT